MEYLCNLITESRNSESLHLDQMSTLELLTIMNNEDMKIAKAVQRVLPQIENAVNKVHHSLASGGRLFYVGAGTSGRLGVLDASECPPTFLTDPEMVQAVMAGGESAIHTSVEDLEDNEDQAKVDLQKRNLVACDSVVGITASGRTPYAIGALKYAKAIGATAISISSNPNSVISQVADVGIEAVVGPEILTGSTRLKAGTAHKMILNMISTATMVKLGKVYSNLMVDLNACNDKLRERSKQIIMSITGITYDRASEALQNAKQEVKPAIVMLKTGLAYDDALKALNQTGGSLRQTISMINRE